MNDIALNQFIFPNYQGINLGDKASTKKTALKSLVAVINGEESKYSSRYEASRLLGISSSLISSCIINKKSATRKNGDVVSFREVKNES